MITVVVTTTTVITVSTENCILGCYLTGGSEERFDTTQNLANHVTAGDLTIRLGIWVVL